MIYNGTNIIHQQIFFEAALADDKYGCLEVSTIKKTDS